MTTVRKHLLTVSLIKGLYIQNIGYGSECMFSTWKDTGNDGRVLGTIWLRTGDYYESWGGKEEGIMKEF